MRKTLFLLGMSCAVNSVSVAASSVEERLAVCESQLAALTARMDGMHEHMNRPFFISDEDVIQAAKTNPTLLEKLLANGGSKDAQMGDTTALMAAVASVNVASVTILLEQGASLGVDEAGGPINPTGYNSENQQLAKNAVTLAYTSLVSGSTGPTQLAEKAKILVQLLKHSRGAIAEMFAIADIDEGLYNLVGGIYYAKQRPAGKALYELVEKFGEAAEATKVRKERIDRMKAYIDGLNLDNFTPGTDEDDAATDSGSDSDSDSDAP